jgi:RNA polymerase sigma-70 factor (ECF subfamily)
MLRLVETPREPAGAPRSGLGPSDGALVIAARAGEAWAREALFRRHLPMAMGLALRLIGRDADLDDLAQDCFVAALRGLHRLEDPQAFAPWLSAIVVRTSRKLLRRRRLARALGLFRPEPINVDQLVSRDAPADVVAELHAIYALVEELPPNVRVPLILRRVEGLPLDAVAELTGASLATVKRRVAEGEQRLEAAEWKQKAQTKGPGKARATAPRGRQ